MTSRGGRFRSVAYSACQGTEVTMNHGAQTQSGQGRLDLRRPEVGDVGTPPRVTC
jgi:hypothetical protein